MELFKEIKFLSPCSSFPDSNCCFTNLTRHFKHFVDLSQLEIEWRNLKLAYHEGLLDEENIELLCMKTIKELKGFDGGPAYPNLTTMVGLIMILPHSNAEAERIFPVVSDVKVKKRNRLGQEVLNGVCVVRSAIQDSKSTCVNFPVTK